MPSITTAPSTIVTICFFIVLSCLQVHRRFLRNTSVVGIDKVAVGEMLSWYGFDTLRLCNTLREPRNFRTNLRAPYLNAVRSIVIAAITTATIAIQFAHRTSPRLTSESHLLRARCRLSLLALRNIIRTHLLRCFVSRKVCIEKFFTKFARGYSPARETKFWPPGWA